MRKKIFFNLIGKMVLFQFLFFLIKKNINFGSEYHENFQDQLYFNSINRTYYFNHQELYLKTVNNPHNFKYLIKPIGNTCSDDILLIAIVCISPSHIEQRNLIRKTWANSKQFQFIRVVFLVGLSFNKSLNSMLFAENQFYDDIIQEDFIDTYENLTLKTIMGIKWISEFCTKSKFVLKIDDDVVVNTLVLIRFLKNRISLGYALNYYMGSLQKKAKIIRNNKSKWFISQDEYKSIFFPNYNQGPAYMFTTDLAQKLYTASLQTQFFRFEDVYIGILANRIGARFLALNNYFCYNLNSLTSQSELLRTKLFVFLNNKRSFEKIWKMFPKE